MFIKAESNYSFVNYKDGEKDLFSKTLGFFENKLGEEFIRVHRSYLVNSNHIKFFDKKTSSLVMTTETKVPVSSRNGYTWWINYLFSNKKQL